MSYADVWRNTVPRCWCYRPIPATSRDGMACAEHDHPPPWPARWDERYDPSPEPRERRIS